MTTAYLEAVTGADQDNGNFDPYVKQKQVYKYYDSKYSDEALDIYSEEWQERIIYWHQRAINHSATHLSSDELLEKLDFGCFFLAHPIAAFSLWQVLQACYELDRAVCGDVKVVNGWEQLKPFEYLRDERIQAKWHQSLDLLKEQIKEPGLESRESWEYSMYEILLGVERFEDAFQSLKENFSINLANMKCATWMIERIGEDIGKRFSMIDRLLEFKGNELANIRPGSNETNEHPPVLNIKSAPGNLSIALPRKYRTSLGRKIKEDSSNVFPPKPKSPTRTMSMSSLKSDIQRAMKNKYRKMKQKTVGKPRKRR